MRRNFKRCGNPTFYRKWSGVVLVTFSTKTVHTLHVLQTDVKYLRSLTFNVFALFQESDGS